MFTASLGLTWWITTLLNLFCLALVFDCGVKHRLLHWTSVVVWNNASIALAISATCLVKNCTFIKSTNFKGLSILGNKCWTYGILEIYVPWICIYTAITSHTRWMLTSPSPQMACRVMVSTLEALFSPNGRHLNWLSSEEEMVELKGY